MKVQLDGNGNPIGFVHNYGNTYHAFTVETITIERKGTLPDYVVDVLHAKPNGAPSFGVVLKTKPYFAVRQDAAGPDEFAFFSTSVETSVPVLTALRCPIDKWVDNLSGSDDHNSRLAMLGYRTMRAVDVGEVRKSFENHDAGWVVEACVVDRGGRIFAAPAATIPVRGNAAVLDQDPAWDPVKHYEVYDKLDTGALVGAPVPAWKPVEDPLFEWQRDAGKVMYLTPSATAPQGQYLGHVSFDPNGPDHPTVVPPYPPPPVIGLNPSYENPGFVTAANEYPWHFYKKRFLFDGVYLTPPDTQNDILDAILTSWTLHQAWILVSIFEAGPKNQLFIDHFLDIAEPSASPMSEASAKDFCNNRNLHVVDDYMIWNEAIDDFVAPSNPTEQHYRQLPIAIRILHELQDNLTAVEAKADADMKFFRDLWTQINSTQGLKHRKVIGPGLQQWVNLKDSWVYGTDDPFWYPELVAGTGSPGNAKNFDMPVGGQLIDFLWTHTLVGGDAVEALPDPTTAAINLASTGSATAFSAAMTALIDWYPQPFKYTATSDEALLYEQNLQGYNGANYFTGHFTGRRWVPLFDGVAKAHDSLFFGQPLYQMSALTNVPLVGGALPPGFDKASGTFTDPPYTGKKLTQFNDPWSDLQSVVFPPYTWASAWKAKEPGPFPITSFVELKHDTTPGQYDVHDALYTSGGAVKSVLTAQDVNEIVKFLLQLGGWDDPIGAASTAPLSTPSKKKLAFENWIADWGDVPHPATPHAMGYPLTRDMVRVVVLRRLADAKAFVDAHLSGLAYGDVVRQRAFAYDGFQKWPLVPGTGSPIVNGAPSGGYGVMGAAPAPDHTQLGHPPGYEFFQIEEQKKEGFAERYWAKAGSTWPLATFFPNNGGPVRSFFRISPGNRVMAFDSVHFPGLMQETADTTFAVTHYNDYQDNLSTDPEMAEVTHRYP